jgi:hypothetical protein
MQCHQQQRPLRQQPQASKQSLCLCFQLQQPLQQQQHQQARQTQKQQQQQQSSLSLVSPGSRRVTLQNCQRVWTRTI